MCNHKLTWASLRNLQANATLSRTATLFSYFREKNGNTNIRRMFPFFQYIVKIRALALPSNKYNEIDCVQRKHDIRRKLTLNISLLVCTQIQVSEEDCRYGNNLPGKPGKTHPTRFMKLYKNKLCKSCRELSASSMYSQESHQVTGRRKTKQASFTIFTK